MVLFMLLSVAFTSPIFTKLSIMLIPSEPSCVDISEQVREIMDKVIYTLKSNTPVTKLILTKCTLVWQLQVVPVPNFVHNLTVCHKC